ncbi:energy-coupled thiamine transporter ThiT [Gottfriedia acidiceleris]|uniref:energy-coupled thiamine transporter ThiT n=1 Tax=Bacillaceae TaxID=186817 RepID=UPI000BF4A67D|nr:energy-coupled thiamine transporter ThiT [Bacillus sp. AFS077874]PFM79005.1 energy-coupled thiamine transporter ThiT [Bacillus sp. AFS077874]
MKTSKIQLMTEIAMCAALAIVFDFLPLFTAPQGGSVSLSMIPVFLIAFRWGLKQGLITGLLLAALQIVTKLYFVHPIQVFLDYILAFTSLGLAGLVYKQIKNSLSNGNKKSAAAYIILGTFIGSLARFICHFIAGIVFYGSYAPKGTPVSLYSLVYNAWYMVPSFIISAVLLIILLSSAPALVHVKKNRNQAA